MVSGCCCLSYADVRAFRTPTVLSNWKDTTHWLQNIAKTKREAAFIEEIIFVEDCKEFVYLVYVQSQRKERKCDYFGRCESLMHLTMQSVWLYYVRRQLCGLLNCNS
mmetsp:Transcript_19429/g.32822  ORF Transcript_19429/g.32822 Transcript_19429/m.32822 type:complete len:107 (+) Transcript_19429:767-1087(+)